MAVSMEQQTADCAHFLLEKLAGTSPSTRVLVGIAGIPASGKSTFAAQLTGLTNSLLVSNNLYPCAISLGLDGWHLSRAQLDALPDPKMAHDRRGIHWTFDASGYVAFVSALRRPLTASTTILAAPSFDHALKDPTYNDILIHPYHRIVIIEGLYTLLSIAPWNEAGLLLDERWLIEADINDAKQRIVARHIATGVAANTEEAIWRAKENDMPNGHFVIENMLKPTRTIQSV